VAKKAKKVGRDAANSFINNITNGRRLAPDAHAGHNMDSDEGCKSKDSMHCNIKENDEDNLGNATVTLA